MPGGGNQSLQIHAQHDLYEVLGVPKSATADQIKSAYKKAALKFHPDKNCGAGSEEAGKRFQEISSAYAVLSDPGKKAKYDARGFAGLEPNELDAEIDVSSLGLFSTMAAAMVSKLGVPLKTSIAASVLEDAYEGRFQATRLDFSSSMTNKVEKGKAVFYEVVITQAHIDDGFVIGAYSSIASKFKLLLFEQTGDTRWEMQHQEDSMKCQRGLSMATLFFLNTNSYCIGPPPAMQAVNTPEALLFQRLESMAPRESYPLKPGKIMVAVYNDNWFKRAQVTLTAVLPSQEASCSNAIKSMQQLERGLLEKQSCIRAFESEYRQVQDEWKKVCDKFASLHTEVETVMTDRENAYLKLLGVEETVAERTPAPSIFQAWGNITMQR